MDDLHPDPQQPRRGQATAAADKRETPLGQLPEHDDGCLRNILGQLGAVNPPVALFDATV